MENEKTTILARDFSKELQAIAVRRTKIRNNEKYAYGINRIKEASAKAEPDNRISVPLAKSAITDIVGYSARPGEIRSKFKNSQTAETDAVSELFEMFAIYNDEGTENSELLTRSLSVGSAYELWWTSDRLNLSSGILTPEFKILDNSECLPIYSRDLKPRLKEFLRIYEIEGTSYIDVYNSFEVQNWEKRKGADHYSIADVVPHPFGQVPIIEYTTASTKEAIFEAQKDLIDCYDSIISLTQNEVDRFNAVLLMFSQKVRPETLKTLEKERAYLDNFQDGMFPKYLEKNLGGVKDFYLQHADRIERLFRETIKIPNFQDESFGANQSGVAMAYKLLGLEFLTAQVEIYFRKGMQKRLEFYNAIIEASTLSLTPQTLSITWNRNLPINVQEVLDGALKLASLGYSSEAIDEYIPNNVVSEKLSEGNSIYDA